MHSHFGITFVSPSLRPPSLAPSLSLFARRNVNGQRVAILARTVRFRLLRVFRLNEKQSFRMAAGEPARLFAVRRGAAVDSSNWLKNRNAARDRYRLADDAPFLPSPARRGKSLGGLMLKLR